MGTSIIYSKGGAAASTVQNMTATGSVTAWNSIVTQSSAGATTVTLPAALAAGIGTSVTVRNTGTGVVTVAPFAGNTLSGQTSIGAGGAVTYTVTAAGTVVTSQDVTPGSTPLQHAMGLIAAGTTMPAAGNPIPFVYSTGASIIAGNTITLQAGKSYLLQASLARVNGPLNLELTYQFRDTTAGADLGSPGVATTQTVIGSAGGALAMVTPSVTTTVQLWVKKNIVSGAVDANNGTNAGAVVITELPGTAVVAPGSLVPTPLQQIQVTQTAGFTVGAVGAAIVPPAPSTVGTIPYNAATGVFTLAADSLYDLTAALPYVVGEVIYQWRDIGANTLIGVAGNVISTAATSRNAVASAMLRTTTATTVRLELMLGAAAAVPAGSGRGTFMKVVQLPTSTVVNTGSVPVTTDATLTGATNSTVPSTAAIKGYVDARLTTPVVLTFTANGTYTPTAGMKWFEIEMVGGGGGGGGAAATNATTVAVAESGGGGGYVRAIVTAAQIGASVTVNIGAAGAAGAAGAIGGSGGQTLFGSLMTAGGGGGGTAGGARTGASAVLGGAGGNATVTTGSPVILRTGEAGGVSFGAISGLDVSASASNAGGSPMGAGGRATVINGATASALGSGGVVGLGFGSGGSGALTAGTAGAARVGAAGTGGRIVIREFF